MTSRKTPKPSEAGEDAEKIIDDAKSFLDKALSDIGTTTATKQFLLGSTTGWLAGFAAMRFGHIVGLGLGGGAFMLHYANEKGYIDINWDKINKKVDKLADKIEKEATGKSPGWVDKMERFVDRKLDKAEELINKKQIKAKRWFESATGNEYYSATTTDVFVASFVAGLAIGLLCGR